VDTAGGVEGVALGAVPSSMGMLISAEVSGESSEMESFVSAYGFSFSGELTGLDVADGGERYVWRAVQRVQSQR
jgi:hypothetical protein